MAVSTSEARRNLARLIERVNLDRTEIEIVSKRGSAVLMAKDEFDALVETSYLLSSPANAHRLMSALQSAVDAGRARVDDALATLKRGPQMPASLLYDDALGVRASGS